jgi:thioredoxin-related protein
MKTKSLFIIIFSGSMLLSNLTFSQIKEYKFEQIDSLQKVEKRIVVVFIHTAWCRYCEAMKHTTFKNKPVINTLNKNFYFINFNAEEKGNISFNNNTFRYKPTGNQTGINELADHLGNINGKISFPAICFLNADNQIIYQLNEFLSAKDFEIILTQIKKYKESIVKTQL